MALLTIAIPTYNREGILRSSIAQILPQIRENRENIELILSDNASPDDTWNVIQEIKASNPDIAIVTNRQETNTGYFGNFKKCRELSTGKYIWLLSDNEAVIPGFISKLVGIIRDNDSCGAYFIDYTNSFKLKGTINFLDANVFFRNQKGYLVTLMSSVIFLNKKDLDDKTYTERNNNLFLGFLLFINAIHFNRKICLINERAFLTRRTSNFYDVFQAWTYHISQCLDYMVDLKIITKEHVNSFITGFLNSNLYYYIINYRVKPDKRYIYNQSDLLELMDKYFSEISIYNKKIRHVLLCSLFEVKIRYRIIKFKNLFRKGVRKIKRLLFK